jgi:hypothetical protein
MMSNYKEEHKQILLSSIAEAKELEWSTEHGLVDSETQEVIAVEPNDIAKKLLGQMTSEKDLATVESILNVVTRLPNYDKLVESARKTLAEENVTLPESAKLESYQTGTPGWFRRMMDSVF